MAEDEIVEKIRKFILERSGLYFQEHEMPSLKDNITKRMDAVKCPSLSEYYDILASSPKAHREFTALLNLLTVKHSHFFRNHEQFIALRDRILPEILEEKARANDLTLRILSAGCATGEEPYSIAMIVLSKTGYFSPWKVSILATDISTEALVRATNGIYPRRVLQHVQKDFVRDYMEKFCLIQKDNIYVSPAIKKMVEFQYMNLVDESYSHGFDIIFCRNVTIYFEIETVKKVIENFYQGLNDKGYLFIGGTETLYTISDKFELLEVNHAFVYKKISSREIKPAEEKVWTWQEAITEPQEHGAVRSETQEKDARAIEEVLVSKESEEPAKVIKKAYETYEKARNFFVKKDYEKAIESTRTALKMEPSLREAHVLLAHVFINQDRLKEAEEECRNAIEIDFLSAEPRCLLGIIYKKQERYKEALENLLRAIYSDPNYSLAYFAIADLYREQNHTDEALKAFRNTLKALEEESEEHFRESSGGLSKKVLTQMCERSIKELS